MKRKRKYVSMGVLLTGFLLITLFLFYSFNLQQSAVKSIIPKHYEKEYVMIAEGEDSQFWQNVYKSGQKEAIKNDAYLKWMEKDSSEAYSMEDYMKIAIASKVDGIFIHPDGSTTVRELINQAQEEKIPVITLVDDDTQSDRISCIGLNAYQMGQEYADEINQYVTDKTKHVEVLLDEKDTANNDIIFNQMKSNIHTSKSEEGTLSITALDIAGQNTFDSEEGIRNVFIDNKNLPDILVCLSDTDTQAACQAIVDYNQVGNISIIGYYLSDTVKNAINKGIIQSAIVPDTDQIGKQAIDAMSEYSKNGNVSEYTSITLNVVTKDTIRHDTEN